MPMTTQTVGDETYGSALVPCPPARSLRQAKGQVEEPNFWQQELVGGWGTLALKRNGGDVTHEENLVHPFINS